MTRNGSSEFTTHDTQFVASSMQHEDIWILTNIPTFRTRAVLEAEQAILVFWT